MSVFSIAISNAISNRIKPPPSCSSQVPRSASTKNNNKLTFCRIDSSIEIRAKVELLKEEVLDLVIVLRVEKVHKERRENMRRLRKEEVCRSLRVHFAILSRLRKYSLGMQGFKYRIWD